MLFLRGILIYSLSQAAHGRDDKGNLRCALANTEWGKIPGYVRDSESTCFFEYCGARSTADFTLVKGAVLTDDANDVLPLGDADGDEVYCAVAQTTNGSIPGMVRNGQFSYVFEGESKCWPETAGLPLSYVGPRKTPLDVAAAENRAKVSGKPRIPIS